MHESIQELIVDPKTSISITNRLTPATQPVRSIDSMPIPLWQRPVVSASKQLDRLWKHVWQRPESCNFRQQGIWKYVKDCESDSVRIWVFLGIGLLIVGLSMLVGAAIVGIQDARARRRALLRGDAEAGFPPYHDESDDEEDLLESGQGMYVDDEKLEQWSDAISLGI